MLRFVIRIYHYLIIKYILLCEIFGNFSVTFSHCRLSMDEVRHEHVAEITVSEEEKKCGN